jgi:hypothetical protein
MKIGMSILLSKFISLIRAAGAEECARFSGDIIRFNILR